MVQKTSPYILGTAKTTDGASFIHTASLMFFKEDLPKDDERLGASDKWNKLSLLLATSSLVDELSWEAVYATIDSRVPEGRNIHTEIIFNVNGVEFKQGAFFDAPPEDSTGIRASIQRVGNILTSPMLQSVELSMPLLGDL